MSIEQAAAYGNLAALCGLRQQWQAMVPLLQRQLALDPGAAAAWCNLGLALLQLGRVAEAISAYRRAVALPAGGWQSWFGLGNACRQQGDAAAAIEAYQRCLELQPFCVEAAVNLGGVYRDQGELAAAEATYTRALALQPAAAQIHYNLASLLQDQGRLEAAIRCYRRALEIQPDFAQASNNLGNALAESDDHAGALAAFDRALSISPAYGEAHLNRANVLRALGRLDEASQACRLALQAAPQAAEAHHALAALQLERGDLAGGLHSFRAALACKPDFLEAVLGLANAHTLLADLPAAKAALERALQLRPQSPEARFSFALLLFRQGDYRRAWPFYESRGRRDRDPIGPGIERLACQQHAQPQARLWQGHPLAAGEPLLLVSEQGLGDTLQFCRYVLALRRRGVVVSLCAQQPLHRLLQASGLEAAPLTAEQAEAVAEGCWSPLLSLPGQLGVSPHNPIIQEPYLAPSAERREHWRRILAAERRPLLGLNWQGNPTTEVGSLQGRSLPLEALAPLAAAFEGSLLSLQKGPGSEQLASCSFRRQFVDCQEQLDAAWDFDDAAAMIAQCDLVITTDTAVAHLAGGMGHPTWLLLQQVPDWRWGLEGESTFWYPSLRLFRQRQRGDWGELIERVAAELGALHLPTLEGAAPWP